MKKQKSTLPTLFLISLFTTMPYIIASSYFLSTQKNTTCLNQQLGVSSFNTTTNPGYQVFTLGKWLRLLTLMQFFYLAFMGFNVIVNYSLWQGGICSMSVTFLLTVFYGFFEYAWVIIGSISYWGQNISNCTNALNIYVQFVLCSIYIAKFVNLLLFHRYRKIKIPIQDDQKPNKQDDIVLQKNETNAHFQLFANNLMQQSQVSVQSAALNKIKTNYRESQENTFNNSFRNQQNINNQKDKISNDQSQRLFQSKKMIQKKKHQNSIKQKISIRRQSVFQQKAMSKFGKTQNSNKASLFSFLQQPLSNMPQSQEVNSISQVSSLENSPKNQVLTPQNVQPNSVFVQVKENDNQCDKFQKQGQNIECFKKSQMQTNKKKQIQDVNIESINYKPTFQQIELISEG